MKMQALIAGVLWALSTCAQSTKIVPVTLDRLVAEADFIVIGKVVKVDIIGGDGQVLADLKVQSPYDERFRLHAVVDRGSIIKGDRKKIPKMIVVPVWIKWKETLENKKKSAEGKSFIFLLKGKDFPPVSEPESVREMTEREAIVKLAR